MSLEVAAWGAATIVPVAISYAMHKLPALGLSVMLLLGWCLGRILGAFYTPPESMALYPLIDATFGAAAFLCWRQRQEAWKLVLVALFVVQCAGHSAFWLAYPNDTTSTQARDILYRYVLTNNLLYAAELLTVTWAGGVRDLAGRLVARLSDRLGRTRHLGAPP